MRTEPWASLADVDGRLGVAKASVRRRRQAKGLAADRVGRLSTHKLSDIDQRVQVGDAGGDDKNEPSR